MDELLEQFLVESRELAESATASLLALERAPQDAQQLDSVFRDLHTLKGGAGIVEFAAMERAVHAAEDLLGAARAGRRVLDPQAVGDCLACIDQVLQWLEHIERTGQLPGPDSTAQAARVIARFGPAPAGRDGGDPAGAWSAAEAAAPAAQAAHQRAQAALPDSPPEDGLPERAREILSAQQALLDDSAAAGSAGHVRSAARVATNVLQAVGWHAAAARFRALADAADPDSRVVTAALATLIDAPATAGAGAPETHESTAGTSPGAATSRTVRVDAARIDSLVRLTGELTVVKNAIAHLARLTARDDAAGQALRVQQASLEQLTAELQRAVLHLRVLPVRSAFQRLPRLVREMSDALARPAELHFSGEDTEADKAIVEMLFEPLLHVVRNALDHGIEPAAVRASRGKPVTATLRLHAAREGSQVLVEVSDDGGGMDLQRIRSVAAERGLATAEALEQMDDAQLTQLVFAPGFSTASEVTALSGRGVGMDAVRVAVERIGGRVSIQTTPGQGTTVRFMLPFSVMMTRVISLVAGGQMFGVPLDSVVETLRVPRAQISAVGAARALVLRDQTIPVLDLGQMLGAASERPVDADATLVVVSLAGQSCALEVDAVGERLEVMLKPLEGLLAGAPAIAGSTLLGDGRVLLVLDVAQLLRPD